MDIEAFKASSNIDSSAVNMSDLVISESILRCYQENVRQGVKRKSKSKAERRRKRRLAVDGGRSVDGVVDKSGFHGPRPMFDTQEDEGEREMDGRQEEGEMYEEYINRDEGERVVDGRQEEGEMNELHRAGLGHTNETTLFTQVEFQERVELLAAGWDFSLLTTETGDVYSCGSNAFGQLGKAKICIDILFMLI